MRWNKNGRKFDIDMALKALEYIELVIRIKPKNIITCL